MKKYFRHLMVPGAKTRMHINWHAIYVSWCLKKVSSMATVEIFFNLWNKIRSNRQHDFKIANAEKIWTEYLEELKPCYITNFN